MKSDRRYLSLIMPKRIELDINETLPELKKLHLGESKYRFRTRLKALIFIKSGKCSYVKQLAGQLGYSRDTIHCWINSYKRGGLQELLCIKSGGNARKVIPAEVGSAIKHRLSGPQGYFTSYKELQQWVDEHYLPGINYQSLYTYVKKNFETKFKTPRKSHIKKDQKAVEAFKKTA